MPEVRDHRAVVAADARERYLVAEAERVHIILAPHRGLRAGICKGPPGLSIYRKEKPVHDLDLADHLGLTVGVGRNRVVRSGGTRMENGVVAQFKPLPRELFPPRDRSVVDIAC